MQSCQAIRDVYAVMPDSPRRPMGSLKIQPSCACGTIPAKLQSWLLVARVCTNAEPPRRIGVWVMVKIRLCRP